VNGLFYSNSLNPNLAVQDDARYGWGKRPYSWEFSVSAQREIGRGVSVNGGVFRRWFGNFLVTDDTNHLASDYTAFSIPVSSIPPPQASAGGQTLPASGTNTTGFYNVNDTTFNSPSGPADAKILGLDAGGNGRRGYGQVRERHAGQGTVDKLANEGRSADLDELRSLGHEVGLRDAGPGAVRRSFGFPRYGRLPPSPGWSRRSPGASGQAPVRRSARCGRV